MRHGNEQCYRALIFDDEEEYADYIALLTEKIRVNSTDYVSLNNRGLAYFEMGEFPNAILDFTEACKFAPPGSAPFLNIAEALRKKDE